MAESVTNTAQKAGMSPGTLVHVASVHDSDSNTVTWLNIEGLSDVTLIEFVRHLLHIHPVVLEDILNTHQRPKFEEHDNYLYIVLKRLSFESGHFAVIMNR